MRNEGSRKRQLDKLWSRTRRTGGCNKHRTRRQLKKYRSAIEAHFVAVWWDVIERCAARRSVVLKRGAKWYQAGFPKNPVDG